MEKHIKLSIIRRLDHWIPNIRISKRKKSIFCWFDSSKSWWGAKQQWKTILRAGVAYDNWPTTMTTVGWTLIFHFHSHSTRKWRSTTTKNPSFVFELHRTPDLTLHFYNVPKRRQQYIRWAITNGASETTHTKKHEITSMWTLIVITVLVSSRLSPLSYFDCMQFEQSSPRLFSCWL